MVTPNTEIILISHKVKNRIKMISKGLKHTISQQSPFCSGMLEAGAKIVTQLQNKENTL